MDRQWGEEVANEVLVVPEVCPPLCVFPVIGGWTFRPDFLHKAWNGQVKVEAKGKL